MYTLRSIDSQLDDNKNHWVDAELRRVCEQLDGYWDAVRIHIEPYPGGFRSAVELVTTSGLRTRFALTAVSLDELVARLKERLIRKAARSRFAQVA